MDSRNLAFFPVLIAVPFALIPTSVAIPIALLPALLATPMSISHDKNASKKQGELDQTNESLTRSGLREGLNQNLDIDEAQQNFNIESHRNDLDDYSLDNPAYNDPNFFMGTSDYESSTEQEVSHPHVITNENSGNTASDSKNCLIQ